MPIVTEVTEDGWTHCGDVNCAGNAQQPIRIIRRETSWMFTDNAGDIPGVERSNVEIVFADENDRECPHCSTPDKPVYRQATDQKRPEYENLSGFDPNGLLDLPAFDPKKVNTEADERHAAEMADLRKQVADLTKAVAAANGNGNGTSTRKASR